MFLFLILLAIAMAAVSGLPGFVLRRSAGGCERLAAAGMVGAACAGLAGAAGGMLGLGRDALAFR